MDSFLVRGVTVITCGSGERPNDLPTNIKWQICDVANPKAVAAMAAVLKDEYGELSVLVNNAGAQIEKTILDTSDVEWDALMGVNARGVFLCCRAFIPQMSIGGSIINIGSISGRVADPALALYNASKAFVHGLTRSIAVDHGPNVRCNAIQPGWIMTAMADDAFALANNPEAAKADALSRHPVGRFGKPEDIADLVGFLSSDQSHYISGECITIDGGMTAASPLQPGLY